MVVNFGQCEKQCQGGSLCTGGGAGRHHHRSPPWPLIRARAHTSTGKESADFLILKLDFMYLLGHSLAKISPPSSFNIMRGLSFLFML